MRVIERHKSRRQRQLPRFSPALEQPVLIVTANYYEDVAARLLGGARQLLEDAAVAHMCVDVPGALEIPTAIRIAHHSNRFAGYVALGCIIRGETSHYDIVCRESARGLTLLAQTAPGICIGNGILTVDTPGQALERSNPRNANKGSDAAEAALRLIELQRQL